MGVLFRAARLSRRGALSNLANGSHSPRPCASVLAQGYHTIVTHLVFNLREEREPFRVEKHVWGALGFNEFVDELFAVALRW